MKNKFKVGDIVKCVSDSLEALGTFKHTMEYRVVDVRGSEIFLSDFFRNMGWQECEDFKLSNPKPMRDTKGRFAGKRSTGFSSERVLGLPEFMDEVRNDIKELKDSIRLITPKIVETTKEVVQSGFFEPKYGDTFWFIEAYAEVTKTEWCSGASGFWMYAISIGNCFRTEQDAKDHLEYLKAIRRIKKYIYENGMSGSNYNMSYQSDLNDWLICPSEGCNYLQVIPSIISARCGEKLIQDCVSDLEIIKNYSMSHNF